MTHTAQTATPSQLRSSGVLAVWRYFLGRRSALTTPLVRDAYLDRSWPSAAQLFTVWIWVPPRRQTVVLGTRAAGSDVCRLPGGLSAHQFLVQVVGRSHPGRAGVSLGSGRAEVGNRFDGYRGRICSSDVTVPLQPGKV